MNTDGIIYVPQSNIYRINVGGRIVEVDAWALKQAYNIDMIEKTLRDGNDRLKNDFLDSIIRLGGRLAGDLGNNTTVCGNGYTSSYDPIDALYRGVMDPRDNMVASVEMPKPTPDFDPNATPKVYFNYRFPSKRSGDIIDEAIELLNSKKNVNMTKISVEPVFEGFRLRLHSDMPAVRGLRLDKTSVVLIKHAAFDRAHRTDIDADARLMAKLDTDTYIKLRIAFLLYQAVTKIDEWNKERLNSDIFEVIRSDVK